MRDPPLPPLNALRVLDAVARHGNVTRAAKELGVTQTAASHQIAVLERFLGVDLVVRSPGGVTLTQAGRGWADGVAEAFDRLRAANRRLQGSPGRRLVSVSVMPSFGTRWLVPRLAGFFAAHPDIDLRLSLSERLVDFATEEFDVGVRYGRRGRVGDGAEHLLDDHWVVVCAPARAAAVSAVRDLGQVPLFCDDEPGGWAAWLQDAGWTGPLPRWSEVSDSSAVVDAALRGMGVALARLALAADGLASGQLVRPFPEVPLTLTGRGYFLAGPPGPARPEVELFREWVRAEIGPLVSLAQREA